MRLGCRHPVPGMRGCDTVAGRGRDPATGAARPGQIESRRRAPGRGAAVGPRGTRNPARLQAPRAAEPGQIESPRRAPGRGAAVGPRRAAEPGQIAVPAAVAGLEPVHEPLRSHQRALFTAKTAVVVAGGRRIGRRGSRRPGTRRPGCNLAGNDRRPVAAATEHAVAGSRCRGGAPRAAEPGQIAVPAAVAGSEPVHEPLRGHQRGLFTAKRPWQWQLAADSGAAAADDPARAARAATWPGMTVGRWQAATARPGPVTLGRLCGGPRSGRRPRRAGRMVTVRTNRAQASDAGRQRQTQGDLGTQSHGTRSAESAGLPKPRRVRCAADRHRGVVSGHGQCRAPPRAGHVHRLRRDRVVPQLSVTEDRFAGSIRPFRRAVRP